MKLIDKYLLRILLVPLGYCLLAFTMIYVIFDLFDHLGDFIENKTPLLEIGFYYAILVPTMLIHVVPVSLLLAVLFSLSSLTKNNELTAMRASGVSLVRLMLPFVATGLAASLVLVLVNERLNPSAAYWCKKFVSEQDTRIDPETIHTTELAYNNKTAHRLWYIQRFDSRDAGMHGIEVTQRNADGTQDYKLIAAGGRWLDHYMVFTNLTIQEYDARGYPRGPRKFMTSQEMIDYDEKPVDFLSIVKPPEFMSSAELLRYLKNNQGMTAGTRARWLTELHYRLAQPWTCLVVTLLGIPFGNQTGRKGALRGFMLAIGLFFALYALINTGLYMGKEGITPAWVAGWLPHLIFLPVACYQIYRIR